MKKIMVLGVVLCCVLILFSGCSSNNADEIIADYFSNQLSDAEDYSIDITKKTKITKKDSEYNKIIEYATDEFGCNEKDISNLQKIEVDVEVDYGYAEEYTAYFIVGKIKGKLTIIDKEDGSFFSSGFEYEEENGNDGGYSVTFG